jgi:uncharacterized protein involved in cysteine biosynthesis
MISRQDLSVKARRILTIGLGLGFTCSFVAMYAFYKSLNSSAPHYPDWAYMLQRSIYYFSLVELLVVFIALIALPGRLRTLGVLALSLFLFGTSGFLTEGDPTPLPYKQPVR